MLLKQSHGITWVAPTAGLAICAVIRFGLLTYALRHVEVGSRVGGVDRPVECLRDGVIRHG